MGQKGVDAAWQESGMTVGSEVPSTKSSLGFEFSESGPIAETSCLEKEALLKCGIEAERH